MITGNSSDTGNGNNNSGLGQYTSSTITNNDHGPRGARNGGTANSNSKMNRSMYQIYQQKPNDLGGA